MFCGGEVFVGACGVFACGVCGDAGVFCCGFCYGGVFFCGVEGGFDVFGDGGLCFVFHDVFFVVCWLFLCVFFVVLEDGGVLLYAGHVEYVVQALQ